MPVDQYIGGVEHAILHLMYARFFTKALADLGHLPAEIQEPFAALFTQGMILRDGEKMSKNRGNVVSPKTIVERYGADTARSYILFIGPPDQDADWSDSGMEGMHRFLGRLWRLSAEAADDLPDDPLPDEPERRRRAAHAQGALGDREGHERHERALQLQHRDRRRDGAAQRGDARQARRGLSRARCASSLSTGASLLFPFAPHVATDAYHRLTGERVWEQPWPSADRRFLEAATFELVLQVNGKVRDRVQAPSDASREELVALARESARVQQFIDGHEVVKEIVVPGKLVNVVVRPVSTPPAA